MAVLVCIPALVVQAHDQDEDAVKERRQLTAGAKRAEKFAWLLPTPMDQRQRGEELIVMIHVLHLFLLQWHQIAELSARSLNKASHHVALPLIQHWFVLNNGGGGGQGT